MAPLVCQVFRNDLTPIIGARITVAIEDEFMKTTSKFEGNTSDAGVVSLWAPSPDFQTPSDRQLDKTMEEEALILNTGVLPCRISIEFFLPDTSMCSKILASFMLSGNQSHHIALLIDDELCSLRHNSPSSFYPL